MTNNEGTWEEYLVQYADSNNGKEISMKLADQIKAEKEKQEQNARLTKFDDAHLEEVTARSGMWKTLGRLFAEAASRQNDPHHPIS